MRSTEHTPRWLRTLVVVGLGVIGVLAALPASAQKSGPGEETWDGLERAKSGKLEHVYLRPGASLSSYTSIRLDPVLVAFDKNFDPNDRRRTNRVSDSDLEKIKADMATAFTKELTEQLTKAGFTIVDQDGPEVLRVSPGIANLYITAPNPHGTATRTRTYTTNSGHMTLVAELRDSVTNDLLARVVDNAQARSTGQFEMASEVRTSADAQVAFNRWAEALVNSLKEAKEAKVRTASKDNTTTKE
jgi:hypothetical protein